MRWPMRPDAGDCERDYKNSSEHGRQLNERVAPDGDGALPLVIAWLSPDWRRDRLQWRFRARGDSKRGDRCELFDGSDEAVAATGKGFDEAGIVGGVAQGFAELVDSGVEAVAEIDEGVIGPNTLAELIAGDELAGVLEESGQDLKGLARKLDANAGLAEFTRAQVHRERAEAKARFNEVGHFGGNSIIWIDVMKVRLVPEECVILLSSVVCPMTEN